jgi:hypothetical protein
MITRTMSFTLGIGMFASLLCLPAHAQDIEVGTGIFCDTQKQAERFVALYQGNTEQAIKAVNAEENDPTACVHGTVAFIRSTEVVTARNKNEAYHVVRVLVVGILTTAGFRAATPTASFSAEKIDERIADVPKRRGAAVA